MTTKLHTLEAEARKAVADARALGAKLEAGTASDAERAEFDQHMAKGRDLIEQIKIVKADEKVLAEAKSLADLLGPEAAEAVDAAAEWGGDNRNHGAKSLGQRVLEAPQFKSLIEGFKQGDGRLYVPDRARVQSDPIGLKSLFVGGDEASVGGFVTTDRQSDVVMLGRRELRLRNLISVRRTTSDTVDYVKQTSHTNAAAPVAEATSSAAPTTGASSGAALTLNANGGYKPEGAWAFEVVSTSVRTIAEWVPATRRALADVAQLEGLINDELRADLAETEETQIVTGSGSGQNLTGILNTSGIQTQAATTTNDATWFASFRQAVTKIKTTGRSVPNGVLVNPAQAEKIDTAKDTNLQFYGAGPFAQGPRTLWGYPVIESEAITAGTALVGDFSKAVLWDREQATVTMTDSHADFFIRNLIAILAEERVAFGVTRPAAFCTVTGL